ncbi:MAG TPA: pyridoxal-phosphate dependent enzyme, partial [Thermoleophilia bacterium]|nr:pyridoxal-phosphate dependent enzyme [Thermoleophilia bacterium]
MTSGGGRGRGVIAHYRAHLPVTDQTPVVTLGEGDTPLVAAPRLGATLGVELYLKLEGMNPTASFKDRGMTMAVSKVVEDGYRAVICASTGNTSASAAAYAAKAGIRAVVVIPEGKIAMGKLAQAV